MITYFKHFEVAVNSDTEMDIQVVPTYSGAKDGGSYPTKPEICFQMSDETHRKPKRLNTTISTESARELAAKLVELSDMIDTNVRLVEYTD